jgi:hypothetical protein
MSKKFDLYITFPDDLSENNQKLSDLVQSYISTFTVLTNRIFSNNVELKIKGRDYSKNNYTELIKESKAFMFFTHPLFEGNIEYETELNEICEILKVDQIDPLAGFPQIFKICLEPLKKPLKNNCLEQLLSYDFFERVSYGKKVKTAEGDTNNKLSGFYSKFLDVVYDFIGILKASESSIANESNLNYIFLGPTTADLNIYRDEIRRELQHLGFRILPMVNIPLTAQEFEEVTILSLKKTDAVVQLMGSQYGEVVKGSKYSMTELQNKVIKEYMDKESKKPLKRYIWIPSHTKINDQRQALFLNRLRRDDAGFDTEIIESPIETFKTILSGRLGNNHINYKEEYDNISKVYLLTEESSVKVADKLYSSLSSSGLKVLTLDYSEQVGIYARHLQKLRDCDSIIIFQNIDNKYWLSSKLRDIIKCPGIGRTKPFKKIVLIVKSEPEEQLLKLVRTKVELIYNKDLDIDVVLQKLISE